MEPGKKEIKSIQGLSVLAMLCLHLFCRTEFENLYQPFIYVKGYPLCYYLALLSDFCVFGYAFCSGYAHYILRKSENYMMGRLKSLAHLIINYWVILVVFSIVGVFAGYGDIMPGSFQKFLGNMFLYRLSYNGAWWYLVTFVFLVLSSKVVINIIDRYSIPSFCVLAVVYFISYVLRFKFPSDNFFVRQGYLYGMTLFQYAIGVWFNKYQIFTKAQQIWKSWTSKGKYLLPILLIIGMMLFRGLVIPSLFVAPATGTVLLLIFHVLYSEKNIVFKGLHYIGTHSTNIWLTHMFFYLVIFVDLVFVFDNPIIVYGFMLVLTLGTSYMINFLKIPFDRVLDKYWS